MLRFSGKVVELVGIVNEVAKHHAGLAAAPLKRADIVLETTMMMFSARTEPSKFRP